MVDETGPGDRHGADDHQSAGFNRHEGRTGRRPQGEGDLGCVEVNAGTGVDGRRSALGGRLRRLRTAAGLQPVELATAAGLDPGHYRQVENGDLTGLTYLDLLALADALGVPPARVLAD
jgi:hypothetical protein